MLGENVQDNSLFEFHWPVDINTFFQKNLSPKNLNHYPDNFIKHKSHISKEWNINNYIYIQSSSWKSGFFLFIAPVIFFLMFLVLFSWPFDLEPGLFFNISKGKVVFPYFMYGYVFEFLSVDINFFKRKLLPPLPILFMIITLNFLALTLTFEKL